MPVITLPDGSKRMFDKPISVYNIALDIGLSLAKATLAGIVNSQEVDANFIVAEDVTLTLVTAKDAKGLEILRHSCAHLLAQAVKQLYPTAQVTIGPVIADGFYYDFSYERAFTPEDLEKIEKRMYELANMSQVVTRTVKSREDAITYFETIGEKYKAEIITDLPESEILSLYTQGDFTDLCRGPHVPNTSHLKAFKLMRVAGAYWRGDSKNEMLTRIYGTCWADKKQLQEYLTRLEEAEKRDHRKIGKAMNLFHLQEEAPGMVFWHPKGWVIWQTVEQYMRSMFIKYGYQEVRTPQIVDRSLWEKSGHWEKFHESMYSLEMESRQYAIKPMNCPCHVQIYKQGITSYRSLPMRLAEFGSCHRNEASGALHGIMRTRNFVQDDAHIFCMESQIQSEVMHFIDMLFEVYTKFGLTDIAVKLSTRPEKRIGADEIWNKAEKSLADALNAKGLQWELMPGEGAFYGPKIEFEIKDCLNRSWTTGSVQLDFSMPERLNAEYIAEDGSRKHPVMLHRAICGSLERFIGILIEHYAGKLPVWLSPVQIVLTGISNRQDQYLQEVQQKLQKLGIRTQIDLRNEKIGFKIREHTLARMPFIAIAGEKEQSLGQITVRKQDGTDLGALSIAALTELLLAEIENKGRVTLN